MVRVRRGPNAGARWTLLPWSGYWRGVAYEADVVGWIEKFIHPGCIAVDVGAHFGFYTVMMARRVGPTGGVYAFEPEPGSFAKLACHIRLNGLEDHCKVFPVALSDRAGESEMFAGGGACATTTHFRYSDEPAFASIMPCVCRPKRSRE